MRRPVLQAIQRRIDAKRIRQRACDWDFRLEARAARTTASKQNVEIPGSRQRRGRARQKFKDIMGRGRARAKSEKQAVFSRVRACFRQCAWPALRHARKGHGRARENTADSFLHLRSSD
jgi:hypothetical protein